MLHLFNLREIIHVLGYPGIFAMIFAESGLFFCFFLPGASLLFTTGILASSGYLNIWIVIPLVAVAAILGDSIGYWSGAYVGVRFFLKKDTRWFKHSYIEQAKEFYDQHGALAIILARFIPIVRTFAPIVAGVVRMPYRIFLAYNVIGAFLWAGGIVFIGYYLGVHVPFVEQYLTLIVIGIIIVTTFPVLYKIWARKS